MTDEELLAVLGKHRLPEGRAAEWLEWAKLTVEYLPSTQYGLPNADEVAGYLCRLLYLLADFDKPFEFGTSVDLESLRLAFFSGLAIGRCNKTRLAEYLYHEGLNRCRDTGLMRFDKEDRWHPGMQSGSGWTDIVFLTPAGYRHAFPETGDDSASTPQDADREQQAESVADPQMSGTKDAAGSGPVDIDLQPQADPELAAEPTAESQTLAADGDDDDQDATGGGMTWQEARDKAEERRLAGDRFTSYRKMAKAIGCLPAVLHRAIDTHGTVELQQWASKQHGASRLNAAPEVAAVVFENMPQGREPDPADILADDDIDAAMAYLLDQAGPNERARINALTPAEKRRLAETVYRDPDQEEQALRYAELKTKRSRTD